MSAENPSEILEIDLDEIELDQKDNYNSSRASLEERCKRSDIEVREVGIGSDAHYLELGFKNGRDIRWIFVSSEARIQRLLSVPFEKYVFVSDYSAICSYEDDLIEAAIRPLRTGLISPYILPRRLFGVNLHDGKHKDHPLSIGLISESRDKEIEISKASDHFRCLLRLEGSQTFTIKIRGYGVRNHDKAESILKKISDALFFQIDLMSDLALGLVRERRRARSLVEPRKPKDLTSDIQYPKREFDEAPASLYWYARSATGMPLLQFLAFYQTVEYYFPVYSQAEARRKLSAILKDPTFRGDRDADVGRLLSALRPGRGGGFGDERSQLRATIMECVDADSLRDFFELNPLIKEFHLSKQKTRYHKVPILNSKLDLRHDVADRIYDIRCHIVHTKGDGDGEFELLLPFSKEAEGLSFDIELMQFIARAVLTAASAPLQQ